MHHDKKKLHTAPLDGQWVKSSYSNNSSGSCVQIMAIDGGVALGDSKRPDLTPMRYTHAELAAFVTATKTGHLTRPTHN